MKVRYMLQTPWPSDVRNPEGFTGCDWLRSGEIPFVPVAGMMISCGGGDDLRRVSEVYWIADSPDHIDVCFDDEEECANQPAAYWLGQGWSTTDFKVSKKLMGKASQ